MDCIFLPIRLFQWKFQGVKKSLRKDLEYVIKRRGYMHICWPSILGPQRLNKIIWPAGRNVNENKFGIVRAYMFFEQQNLLYEAGKN